MIVQPTVNDYEALIHIWESSVRATHDFLKEEDLQFYKPLILNEYFYQVKLFCHKNSNCEITGFMGIAEDKLEMLFIHPVSRGNGIGKALLNYAIEQEKVKLVDVNEQNAQAVEFYKHMGFSVVNRSEFDGAGKHYSILHMELKS
ncbi:GNAT family N-acetyltransferase [Anaerosinus massiliensis]|uniref:GNAT family N-acetyltransferase n=1 Tax=Massilibacillus massiliensis TaxID=1806837 RepID=UPI000DA5F9D1|nr:GNAT family N-acetyltransferase [Massilibacillus massiliensis]